MNFHLCCFHLLAKNRKKIEAVAHFEEGNSEEVIQAENILIQKQPLPTKIDRVKVTENVLTQLDTRDNSSRRDYTTKRRFTLPSFDEIRRGSKIGPLIEPDTSFNYSSVWPLWPKDIRTGTALPFYLSDPEEIATSDDDDDEDVVLSKFGETSSPINDDFDEIIVKTRRSNSEALNQFARPLTSHPRRRTIIGFGTAPDSPRIVVSPENDKDEGSDRAVIQDDSRTSPIFQAYGSLPSDVDSFLRFSSHFQQEKNEVVEPLPPKNRLDDDLARMHAEKFKSKIAWIHHNRQLDDPNEDANAIRLEVEDGIIFIDSQGKHDSMFDFSPEVQFKTSDIEVDDDNNNLSLHSSLISSTIGSRKSSLESATNLLVNKAIMTILDDQPPVVEEIVKTNGRERPSTAIPLICIDFADDHDVHAEANRIPKINHELDKKATRRHNSCPSSFLTVPTDSMHSSKRKQEAMRPILPRRDFAFREIGVSNIINTIEKRKIKQKRRSKRRRDAFFLS